MAIADIPGLESFLEEHQEQLIEGLDVRLGAGATEEPAPQGAPVSADQSRIAWMGGWLKVAELIEKHLEGFEGNAIFGTKLRPALSTSSEALLDPGEIASKLRGVAFVNLKDSIGALQAQRTTINRQTAAITTVMRVMQRVWSIRIGEQETGLKPGDSIEARVIRQGRSVQRAFIVTRVYWETRGVLIEARSPSGGVSTLRPDDIVDLEEQQGGAAVE